MRIKTSINASLIDACHIVPFYQAHDDTIRNGLALCPTLHRAFDHGLVAIDPDDFTVMVSKQMSEPVESTYSIQQFAGQPIQLPEDPHYYPDQQNLATYREQHASNF